MQTEGKEFRSEIKEARIKHGLTIKQVSDLTGVPYRSLQNWEAGVRKCPDYVTKMIVTMINQMGKVFLIYRDTADDNVEIKGYIIGTEQDAEEYCNKLNKDCKHYWEELTYEEIEHLNK